MVQFRAHSQHQFSGKGLIRLLSPFLTELEIVIDRLPECRLYPVNGCTLKRDDISCIQYFTVKNSGFVIIFKMTGISFIRQDGYRTPASCKKRLIDLLKTMDYPAVPGKFLCLHFFLTYCISITFNQTSVLSGNIRQFFTRF